tara:strand:- start:342 stop:1061 length:720 start_codon:yes stop_codon:yes gene_type:complete
MKTTKRYSTFISGELLDLCIPNENAILEDEWTEWFNDIPNLDATSHGVFPNYVLSQQERLANLSKDKTQIVLLICDKKFNKAVGVISLQNIDFMQRSSEVALNIGRKNKKLIDPLAPLEAMSLITEHAFKYLGILRVHAGQVYPLLKNWNKVLELIGYKTEGFNYSSFVKGHKISDVVLIACHYKDYQKLNELRGSLWGSKKIIKKLISKQPKKGFADVIYKNIKNLEEDHFKFLDEEI